jgi:hypothetical protein
MPREPRHLAGLFFWSNHMSHSFCDATIGSVADFAAIPQSMKDQPRWVCWRREVRADKLTKVPICASDFSRAKSDDPLTWSDFERAAEAFRECGDATYCAGLGFMLGDGFAGVDLDNCFDSEGALKSWARPIVDRFAASYMEISPSGAGLKIVLKGRTPQGRNKRFKDGAIETYSRGRFFAVTGRRYGSAIEVVEMQLQLDQLYGELGEREAHAGLANASILDADGAERGMIKNATDSEIIARMELGDRERKLWLGDFSAYASQSEADLSLVGFIASQTNDRAQIDRIFSLSGLMREKWNRDDYRDATIDRALQTKPAPTAPKSSRDAMKEVAESTAEVRLISFAEVKPACVEWLWQQRVPIGKVTLFAGEGGCNKSTVAYDLAARISAGLHEPLSNTPMLKGKVLIIAGDDDPAKDIRPRLDVMGADVSRIYMIDLREQTKSGMRPRAFNLSDLSSLRAAINDDPEIKLIIIDPVSAFVGKRDANKHSDVYALIAPLNQLAAELGLAVIIVAHTNKAGRGDNSFRGRVNGSSAWTDASRSGFMFVRDRNDDDRRIMAHGKINAAKISKGLVFAANASAFAP